MDKNKKYNFIFLIFFLVILDQTIKYFIRHSGGFYICNKGISFGFLMPNYIFYLIVAVFFLVSFGYLWEKINFKELKINKIGLSFVLGGALGNLVDRYNYNCVIDFIDLNFFPVFNGADVFIFVGAMIIIFKSFKNK